MGHKESSQTNKLITNGTLMKVESIDIQNKFPVVLRVAVLHRFYKQVGMFVQQTFKSACASTQSDQS